jgi:hypothetical protein
VGADDAAHPAVDAQVGAVFERVHGIADCRIRRARTGNWRYTTRYSLRFNDHHKDPPCIYINSLKRASPTVSTRPAPKVPTMTGM